MNQRSVDNIIDTSKLMLLAEIYQYLDILLYKHLIRCILQYKQNQYQQRKKRMCYTLLLSNGQQNYWFAGIAMITNVTIVSDICIGIYRDIPMFGDLNMPTPIVTSR